jgi:perosamine synthetase
LNPIEKLAPGAPPAADFIPLIVPEIRGNEWKYIKECLDTNWVSSVGTYVDRFEKMVADCAGTKYAVATINGTAALHISLILAGVQADDEVLVSSLTFIAPVNAIRYVGAWPIFIDAEPKFWQIDPSGVVDFIENGCRWDGESLRNRRTGRRVKAILPVHILGHPVDLNPILAAAAKYSLPVIEDATEGLGARYCGKNIGGIGHAGCFSFNGNKIITTGGGGMFVTNNSEWAARARYLTTQGKDDPIEYVHNAVGYNYRLTNVPAAMGCAQMEMLDEFVEAKRRIAKRYQDLLASLPGVNLPQEAGLQYFLDVHNSNRRKKIIHRFPRTSSRTGRSENTSPPALAAYASLARSHACRPFRLSCFGRITYASTQLTVLGWVNRCRPAKSGWRAVESPREYRGSLVRIGSRGPARTAPICDTEFPNVQKAEESIGCGCANLGVDPSFGQSFLHVY